MILLHIYSSVAVFQAYTLIRSNQRIWVFFYYTSLISSHLISSGFYEMKSTCITWLQIHLGTFLHLRAASTFLGSRRLVDWEHHGADKHDVCMRTPKVAKMIHLKRNLHSWDAVQCPFFTFWLALLCSRSWCPGPSAPYTSYSIAAYCYQPAISVPLMNSHFVIPTFSTSIPFEVVRHFWNPSRISSALASLSRQLEAWKNFLLNFLSCL